MDTAPAMAVTPSVPPAPRQHPANPRVKLSGVEFDSLTQDQTIDRVFDALATGRGGWIITSNLDHLRRAGHDESFRQMLEEASLVVADGTPLVWASRLLGTPLPERIAGSTITPKLVAEAAARDRSVFLLGGNPGVADAAAQTLQNDYPSIRIAGTHCPPMGFENDAQQIQAIRDALNASDADLVFVALGSPKQECLIRALRDEGVLPRAWWIGVGITLSFITGEVTRAPLWMQKAGLEWLHRLIQEPKRLTRRYLLEGIPFACGLFWRTVIIRSRGTETKEKGQPAD